MWARRFASMAADTTGEHGNDRPLEDLMRNTLATVAIAGLLADGSWS